MKSCEQVVSLWFHLAYKVIPQLAHLYICVCDVVVCVVDGEVVEVRRCCCRCCCNVAQVVRVDPEYSRLKSRIGSVDALSLMGISIDKSFYLASCTLLSIKET